MTPYRTLDIRLLALPAHLRAVGQTVMDQMPAPGLWARVWQMVKAITGLGGKPWRKEH